MADADTLPETPLDGALYMAARGFEVIPLYGITHEEFEEPDGGIRAYPTCTCNEPGCESAGKHPIARPGAGRWGGSSTDPDQIGKWATEYPACNFGAVLGGHTVVDVDPINGGKATYNKVFEAYLPRTLKVWTGSGGWHEYFTGETTTFNVDPGINVKSGAGSYVVVPGSDHISGGSYRVADGREPVSVPPYVTEVGKGSKRKAVERPAPGERIASGRHAYVQTRAGQLLNMFDTERAFTVALGTAMEDEIVLDEKWSADRIATTAKNYWKSVERGTRESSFNRADLTIALALQAGTITPEGHYIFDDLDAVLDAVINGTYKAPRPEYLRRDDGQALFYPGRLHYLFGEDSVGKTWVSLALAVDVLQRGGRVVHLDWDDDVSTNLVRLVALGVDQQVLYAGKYQHKTAPGALGVDAAYAIAEGVPDLVIVDVLANALGARDLDENSAGDYLKWATETALVWTRAGACVVLNDHVTKAPSGAWPRGTGAKRGSADGVVYEVKADRMMMPGQGGELTLTVQKDRHGGVGVRRGGKAATLVFDANLGLTIRAPRNLTDNERLDANDGEIIGLLLEAEGGTLPKTKLRKLMDGNTTTKTRRIDGAIARGRILGGERPGQPFVVNPTDGLVGLIQSGRAGEEPVRPAF